MRESFVFYKSFYDAIETFPKHSQLRLYQAFINYVLTGALPKTLKGNENGLFILFKFIQDKYAILANKDIRFSPAYKVWRQEVLKKDNFTCQYCGKKSPEVQLHAHHIKMFATNEEERFYVDNGITLCHECHKKVHSKEIAICQN